MVVLIIKFILFVGFFMVGFFVVTKFATRIKLKIDNELAGYTYGVVGGIYGVLLAFVVVTVWEHYTEAEKNVETEVSYVVNLYRNANAFPDDVKCKIQAGATHYLQGLVKLEWPAMAKNEVSDSSRKIYNQLWEVFLKYTPASDNEKAWYGQAIEQLNALALARRYRIDSIFYGVPVFMWVVLFIGAFFTIAFSYMFETKNKATHLIMVFCLSSTICIVMILIDAIDHPFSGVIHVTPETLYQTMKQLNIPMQ